MNERKSIFFFFFYFVVENNLINRLINIEFVLTLLDKLINIINNYNINTICIIFDCVDLLYYLLIFCVHFNHILYFRL